VTGKITLDREQYGAICSKRGKTRLLQQSDDGFASLGLEGGRHVSFAGSEEPSHDRSPFARPQKWLDRPIIPA
jgi:hypothetical protein